MAMTKNQIAVIEGVATGNMRMARQAAIAAVAEDESKKNAKTCEWLRGLLDPTLNPQLTELPHEIKGMLEVEEPRESFIVPRYALSPREAELFNRINRTRNTCSELEAKRIRYLNTTLLYGVSGTGKTTFGRYVAAMFDLPFYYINFSRVIASHLGETGSNIAKVFNFVRYEPCVLMLDEIDTVSHRRDGGSASDGELSRVTVTIMQEFDKLNGHQIVIGATNRIDLIDDALLRRFSTIHEVTVPEDAIEASRVARRLLDDIGEAYNVEEIIGFCEKHEGNPQSWIIGKTIEGIVRAIETGEPFSLEGMGD